MAFRAALFDMDGTLLDSMHVWTEVDRIFFEKRGLTVPEDYGPSLAGLTFAESARYTKERFSLPETIEEIIEEWNSQCRYEYTHNVRMKPGALRYLRLLKRAGVKIVSATALPEHLFMPALINNGAENLFDAFASTEECGTGKRTGDIYRLAASRVHTAPEDCIVFEDILEGAIGAKAAGMRCCNVYDSSADKNRAAINELNDFCIRDFDDTACLPSLETRFDRAVIIPAYIEGAIPMNVINSRDFVIAADRGIVLCREAGITPQVVLGDFDSLLPGETIPEKAEVWPSEKDDTDTSLALKKALSLGYEDIVLIGGVGGRLDHTIANLQLLRYACRQGASFRIISGGICTEALLPGTVAFTADGTFSLFAFSPEVTGLSIAGAKYTLINGTLTDHFPLGISNEARRDIPVNISFTGGMLLLVRPFSSGTT